jgi:hypothetical protein
MFGESPIDIFTPKIVVSNNSHSNQSTGFNFEKCKVSSSTTNIAHQNKKSAFRHLGLPGPTTTLSIKEMQSCCTWLRNETNVGWCKPSIDSYLSRFINLVEIEVT